MAASGQQSNPPLFSLKFDALPIAPLRHFYKTSRNWSSLTTRWVVSIADIFFENKTCPNNTLLCTDNTQLQAVIVSQSKQLTATCPLQLSGPCVRMSGRCISPRILSFFFERRHWWSPHRIQSNFATCSAASQAINMCKKIWGVSFPQCTMVIFQKYLQRYC